MGLGHLLEEELLLVGREGAAAGEDDVEQHAEAPQVGALAVRRAVVVVVVPCEHLELGLGLGLRLKPNVG